ncbi:YbaB/EbfC family nucleoid-associated protein [Nonomuraea aridisoli]|uniref:YbaB/EbfC family nucleoid-associated protein n=1 Tax=Nonomuraea aridisoli TaxID=2070368 RepID=UPI0015E897EC|nr:YbaB/EbfC family nucleoid-associated protein [Nonomuraea aridisoli]
MTRLFGPRRNPADISAEELARDAEQAERILAWSERAQAALDEVTGTGRAAGGQVTATVAADGKVLRVDIGERAMRLGSLQLAEEILAALRLAGLDAARRTEELVRESLPGFDPAGALAEFERLAAATWR